MVLRELLPGPELLESPFRLEVPGIPGLPNKGKKAFVPIFLGNWDRESGFSPICESQDFEGGARFLGVPPEFFQGEFWGKKSPPEG